MFVLVRVYNFIRLCSETIDKRLVLFNEVAQYLIKISLDEVVVDHIHKVEGVMAPLQESS